VQFGLDAVPKFFDTPARLLIDVREELPKPFGNSTPAWIMNGHLRTAQHFALRVVHFNPGTGPTVPALTSHLAVAATVPKPHLALGGRPQRKTRS